jgi:guanine deaminase
MHDQFMKEAIKLAQEGMANSQGGPFGAVVVKNNFIIGRGYNKVLGTNDPTAHAEVSAIRDACKTLDTFWLTDCQIYTTCEPCPMCLGAIYWARLNKIYFGVNRNDAAKIGFDDNFFYEEMAKKMDQRKVKMIECLKLEALRPFNEWEKKLDKINY